MLEYYIQEIKSKKFNDKKTSARYIAKIKQRPTIDAKRLYELTAEGNTLSPFEVGLAMDELFDAAVFELEHGRPIQLGRFGTLRVRLEATGKDSPEEVDLNSVKKKTITFIPSRELMQAIKDTPLQKERHPRYNFSKQEDNNAKTED